MKNFPFFFFFFYLPFLLSEWENGNLTSLNVMGLLMFISQQFAPVNYRLYTTDPQAFNPLLNILLPEQ